MSTIAEDARTINTQTRACNRHSLSVCATLDRVPPFREVCFRRSPTLCGRVYNAEDVVEDVPVTSIALELERLCEAHGLVLTTELYEC
jgi:hypothetical protein